MRIVVGEYIDRRTPTRLGEEMQKSAGGDIGVPLCGYEKSRASAGGACVVRGGEGAEGGFFFDDEDPVAEWEGEVGYVFGGGDEDSLGDVSRSCGNGWGGGGPRSRKSSRWCGRRACG